MVGQLEGWVTGHIVGREASQEDDWLISQVDGWVVGQVDGWVTVQVDGG